MMKFLLIGRTLIPALVIALAVGCGGGDKEKDTSTDGETDVAADGEMDAVSDGEDGPTDPIGEEGDCPEGFAWNPYASPPTCVECARPCDLEGETGEIWEITAESGDCVCTTEDGYYFSLSGAAVSHKCDADGDGWVTFSARPNVESDDPAITANARCDIRTVDRFILVNEGSDATSGAEVLLRDTDLGATMLDLYEPDARDDQALLDADETYAPAYNGRRLLAEELNSLTKACVNAVADFNGDGTADLEEWDRDGEALHAFSYFVELHRGWYDTGRYYIQEKSRQADAEVSWALPLTYDAEGHWRDCPRLTDGEFSTSSESIGMDFARYNDSTTDAGMLHHSQFKCVEVVETNPGDDLFRVTPADLSSLFQYNECMAVAGTNFPIGDAVNPYDPILSCTIASGEIGDVGFVSVLYTHYTTSGGYVRGCVNECVETPPSCSGDNVECVPLPEEFGRGICACTNHWEGTLCDVCPGNWDPSADCDACKGHWYGSDCEFCPDHWTGVDCDTCDFDTDADGICDAFDACNLDGPSPPTILTTVSADYTTISGVSLNGSSRVLLSVTAGSSVTLEYTFSFNSGTTCGGCTTQVSHGWGDGADPAVTWSTPCQSFTSSWSSGAYRAGGTYSRSITAPSTPGTWFLGFEDHWFSCPTSGYLDPSNYIGAVCVY